MGLEDLIARRAQGLKTKKKVINIADIDKVAAEPDTNKYEDTTGRTVVEKNSWIIKKTDDAADWSSGPSDDDEDVIDTQEPAKPLDEPNSKESKEIETASHAWGSKAPEKEIKIVDEPSKPTAFVPSAFKTRPKVEDTMEFPTLEAASKEDVVKPKIEPDNNAAWKTAGRSDSEPYTSDRYRSRRYQDEGSGYSRREQYDENSEWTRGNTIQSKGQDSYVPRKPTGPLRSDGGDSFVKGSSLRNQDAPNLSYTPRQPRSIPNTEDYGWERGKVISQASLSQFSDNRPAPDIYDIREEAKAREHELRHKNRFEALSELN